MNRTLRARRRIALLAALAAVVAVGWPHLPPDLQRAPIYVTEFFTKENGTVNTPIVHEMFGLAMGPPDAATRERRLRVAPGWELSVFATDIPHPRLLRVTAAGDLVVSQPRKGRVLLVLRDADGDGRSDGVLSLAEGLDLPQGIELVARPDDGFWLYVAEPARLLRAHFDPVARTLQSELSPVASLPDTTHHHTRSVRQGPDGLLYVPIGSNCNLCEPTRAREQVILRMRPDGTGEEIHASGFRNIVGFDWQPETGFLYASDIGADYQGDDFPPEELNRIERGGFYGFPYASGARIPDPELGAGHEPEIRASLGPAHTFDAHSTPLGLVFLRSENVPTAYRGAGIVALHGSWNRTRKNGHALVSLHWGEDGEIEERPFVTGFEQDEDVIGRPVDVAEGADGSVYVSDDYAGAIYRIRPAANVERSVAAFEPAPRTPEPVAEREAPPELVAAGAALFEAHRCRECHAPADAPGPAAVHVPLANIGARYTASELEDFLAAPPPAMPRFDLGDLELRALAAYLIAGER